MGRKHSNFPGQPIKKLANSRKQVDMSSLVCVEGHGDCCHCVGAYGMMMKFASGEVSKLMLLDLEKQSQQVLVDCSVDTNIPKQRASLL